MLAIRGMNGLGDLRCCNDSTDAASGNCDPNCLPGLDVNQAISYLQDRIQAVQGAQNSAGGFSAWLAANSSLVMVGAVALVGLSLLRRRR